MLVGYRVFVFRFYVFVLQCICYVYRSTLPLYRHFQVRVAIAVANSPCLPHTENLHTPVALCWTQLVDAKARYSPRAAQRHASRDHIRIRIPTWP